MDPANFGLPHRPPFLFIDQILSISSDEVVAEKKFAGDDPVFVGHFPGNPIVPGVLLTEALAQTAGLAAGYERKEDRFLLTGIRSMKFFRAVCPEEPIVLKAMRVGMMGDLYQFDVCARVGETVVAEGVVILNRVSGKDDERF